MKNVLAFNTKILFNLVRSKLLMNMDINKFAMIKKYTMIFLNMESKLLSVNY